MRALTTFLLIVMTFVGGPALALRAQPGPYGQGTADIELEQDYPFVSQQEDGLTLSEAVERVRKQYNGRIVSAETKVSGGREVHVIKVLTDDGKLKTVRMPGRRV